MAKMKVLERRGYKFALALQIRKDHPAAVVAAGKSYYKKNAKSGPIPPDIVSPKLRSKLNGLGKLYSKVNGNTLGCCAEVNAANHVINKLPNLQVYEIEFSNARRPRTMQIIPPCKNCKYTFNL